MFNISGWATFWLVIGVLGLASIVTNVVIKIIQIRQIVKILEKILMEEEVNEDNSDVIREMLEQLK